MVGHEGGRGGQGGREEEGQGGLQAADDQGDAGKGNKGGPNSEIQKKFDRLLLELIGTNFLAFSFIDSPEFHDFVNFLNKNFNIKTAQTYRRSMSNYAKDILSKVIQQLTDFCDVGMAATTDIWSSRTQDSYISLTSHFVDKHFRLHR